MKNMDKKRNVEVIGPITLPILVSPKKVVKFKLSLYKFPKTSQLLLYKGNVQGQNGILVRIVSQCLLAHVFNSKLCDCYWQLRKAINIIAKGKRGILIYSLDQDGRGIGIENHIRLLKEEERWLKLGLPTKKRRLKEDIRNYEDVSKILSSLKIRNIRLLTNNSSKVSSLKKSGLKVVQIPI
jgi:GTP cyclohydrolase II